MTSLGISEDKWAPTCVLIDKLEKVPIDSIMSDLNALGLTKEVVEDLVNSLKMKSIDQFAEKLGPDAEGVVELKRLLHLAQGYGISDWLVFDASVVRGLAYYTGVVFEGFDRSGELRAIFGGGRYDKLLQSMGGEPLPAVGFGFGDAVIVELLKAKGLLPETSKAPVQVMVYAMDASLSDKAVAAASELRRDGICVDMVLDERKPKWVFQRADKRGVGLCYSLHCNVCCTLKHALHEPHLLTSPLHLHENRRRRHFGP